MTDSEIVKFLKEPYQENSKRLLCQCGMLQTHKLRWCNECGCEFNLDPTKISRITVIMNQVNYNPCRKTDNGNNGYSWWNTVFSGIFGKISIEHFKQLCKKAQEE